MCPHDIPEALQGLSIVEQHLIARSRWYGMIVKLSATSSNSRISYFHLKGSIIVVPLKPSKLSTVLPSPLLALTETIKVVWMGKQAPSEKALLNALQVRKGKVVRALQELAKSHCDYKDVKLDELELSTWPTGRFVPPSLLDTVTTVDPDDDMAERTGYAPGTGELDEPPDINGQHPAQWQDGHEPLSAETEVSSDHVGSPSSMYTFDEL
jgi:hypothetical protein